MKPVRFILKTTIDEQIDEVLYGCAFTRINPECPAESRPWVQMVKDGEWIPVEDWKDNSTRASQYRALARHFIEVGKRLAGLVDPKELRAAIERRMTFNFRQGTETGAAQAVEDNEILEILAVMLKDQEGGE